MLKIPCTYSSHISKILVGVITLCMMLPVKSQELPPVSNFSPEIYQADNQNWMLDQDDEGVIYTANNKGLLSYDGAHWQLHPSPNETIVRSVAVVDSLIYTGSYMEFGYWQRDPRGVLSYVSLVEQLNITPLVDEQIWNIITYRDKVLFQSFNRIYSYQPSTANLTIIPFKGTVYSLFKIEDRLLYQIQDEGLFILKDGQQQPWNQSDLVRSNGFIGIHKLGNAIIGITQNGSFFDISSPEVKTWEPEFKNDFQSINVYSSLTLSDGSLAIGTVSQGIIVISEKGELLFHINQQDGLANNTVLSLFEDRDANLWAGLNRGISCLNNHLPFSVFIDREGVIGTTYAAISHQGYTYLGTNQGLFYKRENQRNYSLVEGTKEQVWTLEVIDGTLFCGHNKGTFIIEGNQIKQFIDVPGTWAIKTVPQQPELLIQGNFDGLYILEKKEGSWGLRNKLDGFDISSKFFEFASDQRILVSHEYKGVYELEIDPAFAKVNSYKTDTSVSKGEHASLEEFDQRIFYANKNGIFIYDNSTGQFKRNKYLSSVFDNAYVSGKLLNDQKGRLWAFTKDHLVAIVKDDIEDSYTYEKVQYSQTVHATQRGYENITAIGKDVYLLGTADGYLKIYLNQPQKQSYDLAMRQITATGPDQNLTYLPLRGPVAIPNAANDVSFDFSVPEYNKYQTAEYAYRIENLQPGWSSYSQEASVVLKNLDYGDYTLYLKARVGDSASPNELRYNFEILRPWYLSTAMIVVYVLLTILLFVGLNWFYKRYYRKQRERALLATKKEMELQKLASEKQVIELRNQNLRKDIEARNRELATATMTMINKNKTLNKIKEALLKDKKGFTLDETVALIDANINNEKDWEFFEEAFNHADKDFFKRVKERHPNLTPNDLKLCVYLRLNMSSKEIAPLLNISPRSVEIKRYRLRKKIALDRDVNLNEYFIKM